MLNSDLFSRNLYIYRTRAGMTQKEVANGIGIRQQTVAAWEANRSTPCPDIICALAEIFGITTDQLLMQPNGKGNVAGGRLARIPVVNRAKLPGESYTEKDCLGHEYIDGEYGAEYVFFRIERDCMEPEIRRGDLALVRLQSDAESGELVVAILDGDGGSIKRLLKQAGGMLLQPFNGQYPAVFIPADSRHRVHIFGRVLRTVRKW